MKIKSQIREKAIKTCLSSDVRRSKMSALVCHKKGRILNFAPNMAMYGYNDKWTIHAEEFVLAKCIRQGIFHDYILNELCLLVFRYHPDAKKFSLAKPCVKCTKLICEAGIKCYYTENNLKLRLLKKNKSKKKIMI